ncbi:hypothetical protein ACFOY8_24170 [Thalassospira xianhensis]|uniref:hypothetical protein n=1 Tax=Thalassospira xianhensis TaxID=478503 RepID=UPI00142D27D4|nr:hypothetical protein [Thalassospira xianhensis]
MKGRLGNAKDVFDGLRGILNVPTLDAVAVIQCFHCGINFAVFHMIFGQTKQQ